MLPFLPIWWLTAALAFWVPLRCGSRQTSRTWPADDLQVSLTTCYKNNFWVKNSMDSKSGSAWPDFFDLPIMLEMARTGNEGSADQLRCAIVAVQPCSNTLGRREARHLAELSPPRATASPARTTSRPEADPELFGSRKKHRVVSRRAVTLG